jgi:hypothetical protein
MLKDTLLRYVTTDSMVTFRLPWQEIQSVPLMSSYSSIIPHVKSYCALFVRYTQNLFCQECSWQQMGITETTQYCEFLGYISCYHVCTCVTKCVYGMNKCNVSPFKCRTKYCLHFCTLCTAARWWTFTNGITMRSLFIIHLSIWFCSS